MKVLLSTAAVVLALGVLGFQAGAATAQRATDPEGVLRAIVDAFNAGDAATAASYFAEDATATGLCPPANVCHGRVEFQGQLEREIAEGAQDQIRDLTVNGDTVIAHLSETAPGFAEIGIERTYITATATVQNGLITSFIDELDLTDAQTAKFAQALQEREQAALPASGTGYATGRSQGAFVLALSVLGGALVLAGMAGGGLQRRRARSR